MTNFLCASCHSMNVFIFLSLYGQNIKKKLKNKFSFPEIEIEIVAEKQKFCFVKI